MAIKFSGIGHVAIRCKNFDREFNFYTKVLGFEKILDIYDINQEIWITYLRVKKDSILNFFIKPNVILKTNILGIMNNVIAHPLILFLRWKVCQILL